jgi:hypothetical protein
MQIEMSAKRKLEFGLDSDEAQVEKKRKLDEANAKITLQFGDIKQEIKLKALRSLCRHPRLATDNGDGKELKHGDVWELTQQEVGKIYKISLSHFAKLIETPCQDIDDLCSNGVMREVYLYVLLDFFDAADFLCDATVAAASGFGYTDDEDTCHIDVASRLVDLAKRFAGTHRDAPNNHLRAYAICISFLAAIFKSTTAQKDSRLQSLSREVFGDNSQFPVDVLQTVAIVEWDQKEKIIYQRHDRVIEMLLSQKKKQA